MQLDKKCNDNNIIPFEIYINIYKLFINILNYENSFLNNEKNILKESEEYYLINYEWIDKLKEYEKYILSIITNEEKLEINDNNIDNIIINKDNLIFDKKNIFVDLININIDLKMENIENIQYFKNTSYIINKDIYEIFKCIMNDNNINLKGNIIVKSKCFYHEKTKIYIHNIYDFPKFYPKYVLYNKKEFKKEKNFLLQNSIEEYIKLFKNDTENQNILIKKSNPKITLIILPNQNKENEKSINSLKQNNEINNIEEKNNLCIKKDKNNNNLIIQENKILISKEIN